MLPTVAQRCLHCAFTACNRRERCPWQSSFSISRHSYSRGSRYSMLVLSDGSPTRDRVSSATGGVFATTRWSVVLAAQGDSETGRAALETLCSTYRSPVYAVVRKHG